MPRFVTILWDTDPGKNLEKIAQHGLTRDEVDYVLQSPRSLHDVSRSTGNPILKGYTQTGRWIVVPFLLIDPDTVYPLTAYEPKT